MLGGMLVRNRVLALLFSLTFVTYLDRVCISATADVMRAELGLSRVEMGWVFSAFIAGYVLFEIPGGWMADRFGAKRLLARIVLWWSAFTALTGAALSFVVLLVVRFLFGCGEAGAFPGAAAAIGRWFPSDERGRAQAVVMIGSRLGGAFAPALVIWLMSLIDWRWIYALFAIVGVVWVMVWLRSYEDSPEQHPAVSPAERERIARGRPEPGENEQLSWKAMARSLNTWGLCLMYSGYTFGLYFYFTWLPTYLNEGRGIAFERVGFYAAAPFLAGAICNLLGGWWSDALAKKMPLRLARRIPAMAGMLAAAAFLMLSMSVADPTWGVAWLAMSFGAADLILPVCWATCLDTGRQFAGAVSGTMNSLGQVGGLLAPVLFGWLVDKTGSWNAPLLAMAIFYVLSACAWILIDAERPIVARRVAGDLG